MYTEIKHKNGNRYYYRARSIRLNKKFKKERVYLGVNLTGEILSRKEGEADKRLIEHKINRSLLEIKPKILEVLKKYHITKAGIFGSFVRGEQRKNSDIDILIEPPKGIGFGFVGIQLELEDKLKRKVDLVTYKYISPYLKEKILESEVRII